MQMNSVMYIIFLTLSKIKAKKQMKGKKRRKMMKKNGTNHNEFYYMPQNLYLLQNELRIVVVNNFNTNRSIGTHVDLDIILRTFISH